MSAPEPTILSMEEVRRLTTAATNITPFIERAPLGEAVTERTIRRLCATVEHWHREAQGKASAGKDLDDAENWRTLMSETANAPGHAEMIERATQAFEESQEELRLLRAFEAAAAGTGADSTSSQLLAACRERDRAWIELCAFRARQKKGPGAG